MKKDWNGTSLKWFTLNFAQNRGNDIFFYQIDNTEAKKTGFDISLKIF